MILEDSLEKKGLHILELKKNLRKAEIRSLTGIHHVAINRRDLEPDHRGPDPLPRRTQTRPDPRQALDRRALQHDHPQAQPLPRVLPLPPKRPPISGRAFPAPRTTIRRRPDHLGQAPPRLPRHGLSPVLPQEEETNHLRSTGRVIPSHARQAHQRGGDQARRRALGRASSVNTSTQRTHHKAQETELLLD